MKTFLIILLTILLLIALANCADPSSEPYVYTLPPHIIQDKKVDEADKVKEWSEPQYDSIDDLRLAWSQEDCKHHTDPHWKNLCVDHTTRSRTTRASTLKTERVNLTQEQISTPAYYKPSSSLSYDYDYRCQRFIEQNSELSPSYAGGFFNRESVYRYGKGDSMTMSMTLSSKDRRGNKVYYSAWCDVDGRGKMKFRLR